MTKTLCEVVVDYAICLHERVTGGRPDKSPAEFLQLFTHVFRFGGFRRDFRKFLCRLMLRWLNSVYY